MRPTHTEASAQAATAGFAVDDYVFHHARDPHTAGRLDSFSLKNGQLMAHWLDGGAPTPLRELRRCIYYQVRAQFGEGYEFFTSPSLIAEALHQARLAPPTHGISYTGTWVQGFGTDQPEVWVTTQAQPSHPEAEFRRLTDVPAAVATPGEEISYSMQVLASGQWVTVPAIELVMKVDLG